MNKRDILNKLFVENNLTEEDVFKHQHYTIITRSGIEKIMANFQISLYFFNTASCYYSVMLMFKNIFLC